MNILFVTTNQTAPQKGGTERTTAIVNNELRKRGHKCYNLYDKTIGKGFELATFDGVSRGVTTRNTQKIIDRANIDVIILEGTFTLIAKVAKARDKAVKKPRMFFVHHFSPGSELFFDTVYSLRKQALYADTVRGRLVGVAKLLLYPLYKPYMDNRYHEMYKMAYKECSKVVLLSSEYMDGYCSFGGFSDKSKFCSIPNASPFSEEYPLEEIRNKKKTVLVVSRLNDTQKRISLVIRMWRKIEDDPQLKDWNLKIVGFGESEEDYKNLVTSLSLKRVSFEGQQNPVPYYKESSIYLMTSLYEGFPMTLVESSQFGCISVAYNTCAAFKDVISNGVSGYLIDEGEENIFLEHMRALMLDKKKREQLMANAIVSSKKFKIGNIVNLWEDLIKGKNE